MKKRLNSIQAVKRMVAWETAGILMAILFVVFAVKVQEIHVILTTVLITLFCMYQYMHYGELAYKKYQREKRNEYLQSKNRI